MDLERIEELASALREALDGDIEALEPIDRRYVAKLRHAMTIATRKSHAELFEDLKNRRNERDRNRKARSQEIGPPPQ